MDTYTLKFSRNNKEITLHKGQNHVFSDILSKDACLKTILFTLNLISDSESYIRTFEHFPLRIKVRLSEANGSLKNQENSLNEYVIKKNSIYIIKNLNVQIFPLNSDDFFSLEFNKVPNDSKNIYEEKLKHRNSSLKNSNKNNEIESFASDENFLKSNGMENNFYIKENKLYEDKNELHLTNEKFNEVKIKNLGKNRNLNKKEKLNIIKKGLKEDDDEEEEDVLNQKRLKLNYNISPFSSPQTGSETSLDAQFNLNNLNNISQGANLAKTKLSNLAILEKKSSNLIFPSENNINTVVPSNCNVVGRVNIMQPKEIEKNKLSGIYVKNKKIIEDDEEYESSKMDSTKETSELKYKNKNLDSENFAANKIIKKNLINEDFTNLEGYLLNKKRKRNKNINSSFNININLNSQNTNINNTINSNVDLTTIQNSYTSDVMTNNITPTNQNSNINNNINNTISTTCPICLDDKVSPSRLDNCEHEFCKDCIEQWAKVCNECPLCKEEFKKIIFQEGDEKKVKRRKFKFNTEEEEENWIDNVSDNCMICDKGDNNHLMLVCDKCKYNICHTYCAGLDLIPDEDWFCFDCRHVPRPKKKTQEDNKNHNRIKLIKTNTHSSYHVKRKRTQLELLMESNTSFNKSKRLFKRNRNKNT